MKGCATTIFCTRIWFDMSSVKKTIIIVDDEPDILNLVSLHLKRAGFHVQGFLDAESLYAFMNSSAPALIILDLMLPDADGIEVCKHLKAHERWSAVPIIMLTAKTEEADKVLGLELGADDYVTKPFSPKELVARVKAVLRRQTAGGRARRLEVGDSVVMDDAKHEVEVNGRKVELTPTEFKILFFLASKKGWVFTRSQILDYLWGHEKAVLDRTIDVHIKHLREKLGRASRLIKNVRGVGYKIEE